MNDNFMISISLLEDSISKLNSKENKSENDNMLLSYYTRELTILKHIIITGVHRYNCTIDELKNKLEEKPIVVLFSRDEVEKYNKAVQIMEILQTELKETEIRNND